MRVRRPQKKGIDKTSDLNFNKLQNITIKRARELGIVHQITKFFL